MWPQYVHVCMCAFLTGELRGIRQACRKPLRGTIHVFDACNLVLLSGARQLDCSSHLCDNSLSHLAAALSFVGVYM
jgi:hypothetical protein